jgi:diamine N-acetyltransferase
MIQLRDLNRDNWRACAGLALPAEQEKLVAPNVWSIAEAGFEPRYRPRVICLDETIIGFLMYCAETDPPDPTLFWLFRFMLAPGFQGRGHGAEALRLALEEMKAAGATRVRTMHKPGNVAASRLYRRLGFREIGTLDDGDIELEIPVAASMAPDLED